MELYSMLCGDLNMKEILKEIYVYVYMYMYKGDICICIATHFAEE